LSSFLSTSIVIVYLNWTEKQRLLDLGGSSDEVAPAKTDALGGGQEGAHVISRSSGVEMTVSMACMFS
jgi:hypothetical protein